MHPGKEAAILLGWQRQGWFGNRAGSALPKRCAVRGPVPVPGGTAWTCGGCPAQGLGRGGWQRKAVVPRAVFGAEQEPSLPL